MCKHTNPAHVAVCSYDWGQDGYIETLTKKKKSKALKAFHWSLFTLVYSSDRQQAGEWRRKKEIGVSVHNSTGIWQKRLHGMRWNTGYFIFTGQKHSSLFYWAQINHLWKTHLILLLVNGGRATYSKCCNKKNSRTHLLFVQSIVWSWWAAESPEVVRSRDKQSDSTDRAAEETVCSGARAWLTQWRHTRCKTETTAGKNQASHCLMLEIRSRQWH